MKVNFYSLILSIFFLAGLSGMSGCQKNKTDVQSVVKGMRVDAGGRGIIKDYTAVVVLEPWVIQSGGRRAFGEIIHIFFSSRISLPCQSCRPGPGDEKIWRPQIGRTCPTGNAIVLANYYNTI